MILDSNAINSINIDFIDDKERTILYRPTPFLPSKGDTINLLLHNGFDSFVVSEICYNVSENEINIIVTARRVS